MSADNSEYETIELEVRSNDGGENPNMTDVWVAGQPIGTLIERALQKTKTLEDENKQLRGQVTTLEERVATLEGRVTPDPSSKDYDSKTRAEKVREVRLSCVSSAKQNNRGKGSLEYTDVMTLFDHRPSAGHAYTLLKLAADMAGFEYEKRDGKNDRLRVTLADVNDETVFHGVNKPQNNEGGSQ